MSAYYLLPQHEGLLPKWLLTVTYAPFPPFLLP